MEQQFDSDDCCDDFDDVICSHDYDEDGDEEDYSLRIYSEYIKRRNT